MTFSKSTLNTGLRVILSPIENNKTVTVLILTACGSKYETTETNGISHFLEHMCFKGTVKRPSAELISKELDQIGGEFNAFTSKEYTGYFAKVRSQHAEIALDVVSDIFMHQLLKPEEIEREKGVIVEEINLYQDTPTECIDDLFEELLYENQPAGWRVLGRKENVLKLAQQDFITYLAKHYTAKNSLLVLAGEPRYLESLMPKLDIYFADIRQGDGYAKETIHESQQEPALKLHFKETDQVHIALGVRGYHIFDPRRFPLAVLATILGGGMSSRLFLAVRERRGLAYYIRTMAEHYTDSGYLATFAGIKKEKISEALKIILQEYTRVRDEPIPQEELIKAKEYIKGKMALRLEGSDEIASFLGGQEIITTRILTPEDLFSKIEDVRVEDLKMVASDIFQPSKLNLAIIGPFKNEKPFIEICASALTAEKS